MALRRALRLSAPPPRPPPIGTRPLRLRSAKLCQESTYTLDDEQPDKGDSCINISYRGSLCVLHGYKTKNNMSIGFHAKERLTQKFDWTGTFSSTSGSPSPTTSRGTRPVISPKWLASFLGQVSETVILIYRVTMVVMHLGWVDLDLLCSTLLLGSR